MEQLPYADFLNSGTYESSIGRVDPFYWDSQTSFDNTDQLAEYQPQQNTSTIASEFTIGEFPKQAWYLISHRSLKRGRVSQGCFVQ